MTPVEALGIVTLIFSAAAGFGLLFLIADGTKDLSKHFLTGVFAIYGLLLVSFVVLVISGHALIPEL